MTDEEWEKRRKRAVMEVFKTGRAVFADTDGELRYVDGDCEPIGTPKARVSWWTRLGRWFKGRA